MTYTWNAENRLIAAEPTEPQSGDLRVSFVYDYLGRRVLKVVEEYDGSSWSETARRKFVWSGWLMLVEIDASGETDAVMRQNTWGLDLAGQAGSMGLRPVMGGMGVSPVMLSGAGGIGGLLAVHDTRGTVPTGDDLDGVFTYDANGNVGQVVDLTATTWASAAITAHYEYAPYGAVRNDITGQSYGPENPWRFSTKQWDPETALGYWGRRYYSATLGRWLNEDPIEERGGLNLYAYARNEPLQWNDPLGTAICIFAVHNCFELIPISSEGGVVPGQVLQQHGHGGSSVSVGGDGSGGGSLTVDTGLRVLDPLRIWVSSWCLYCGWVHGEDVRDQANNLVEVRMRNDSVPDENECRWDAMQHCVGVALLARACGAGCAIGLGDMKEDYNDDCSSTRDKHNNRIGARQCSNAENIVECCYDLLDVAPPDGLDTQVDASDACEGDATMCH
jgi:RHS repeat-associated protein